MCAGLPVISYLSMNVDESHIPESFVALVCFGKALLFPTHHTESENTRTSVFNRFRVGDSNRDKLFQNSVSQFCHDEIPQNSMALLFEVFKSGAHSFNNSPCLGNLMSHRSCLDFSPSSPKSKAAHMQSYINILQFASLTGHCQTC